MATGRNGKQRASPRTVTSPVLLTDATPAEWLRVKADRACTATAFLHLSSPRTPTADQEAIFSSLAAREPASAWTGGLLRPAGFSRALQFLARRYDDAGRPVDKAYYEINERLEFTRVEALDKIADLERSAEPAIDYEVDAASVLVTDAAGRRWRLPRSRDVFSAAGMRGVREVVSERYLAHIQGTFYEIPRLETKTVPDFRRMKPVASHRARIADFATWRGLLVIAGTQTRRASGRALLLVRSGRRWAVVRRGRRSLQARGARWGRGPVEGNGGRGRRDERSVPDDQFREEVGGAVARPRPSRSGSRSKWTFSRRAHGTSTRPLTFLRARPSCTGSPTASPRIGCG